MVDMEWLLGDEDVWSVELEYRLKRAITFDPTIGSCSNFYRGFLRLFSMGKFWNRCSVRRMSGRSNMIIWSKEPYHLIRPLDRAQTFTEAFFLRLALESLFSDKDVWSANLSIGSKGP